MKRLIASCLLLSLLLCGCTGAAQLKPDLTTPTSLPPRTPNPPPRLPNPPPSPRSLSLPIGIR